ncbi:MAG: DUF434 domain-containing protein [Deltaproteobacteria bacterium]|nr:DUF434 domain-containing protein [Deltaproteobacteria bacterium]MBM4323819.1 DUF434 domain-containing protein [Deltaproteobacteria bacterium]MBM4347651.1 DUF434 domain-containing protein [Deltaproteobacteria bacterium]
MFVNQPLQKAAEDFRYLLNRTYPRKLSLELVGNRYQLNADERHLLHRGIFSDKDSEWRKVKKIPFYQIRNNDLAIDGYNVIITIESALLGKPLVLGDDGFIRDISGLSGDFKRSKTTDEVIQLILDALKKTTPHTILFLFHAPISKSGALAQEVRNRMKQGGLPGDAQAIKVPEKILIGFSGVVATSDTVIIDQSEKAVDLAATILRQERKLHSLLYLRKTSPSPLTTKTSKR